MVSRHAGSGRMAERDWGIKPMLIAFNDHPYFPVLTSVDRIALEVD